MASHTGQKWLRSFYSSRDFFFKLRVSIQVEIFFIQVEIFQFKSRFFFHVEILISSRKFFYVEIFISSRDLFFPVENFLMSRYFHSCRDFYFFKSRFLFMSRSFDSSRHFSIQGESRNISQDSLLVFPA